MRPAGVLDDLRAGRQWAGTVELVGFRHGGPSACQGVSESRAGGCGVAHCKSLRLGAGCCVQPDVPYCLRLVGGVGNVYSPFGTCRSHPHRAAGAMSVREYYTRTNGEAAARLEHLRGVQPCPKGALQAVAECQSDWLEIVRGDGDRSRQRRGGVSAPPFRCRGQKRHVEDQAYAGAGHVSVADDSEKLAIGAAVRRGVRERAAWGYRAAPGGADRPPRRGQSSGMGSLRSRHQETFQAGGEMSHGNGQRRRLPTGASPDSRRADTLASNRICHTGPALDNPQPPARFGERPPEVTVAD